MGCDVHIYVEKKIDGQWQAIKGVNEPDVEQYEIWAEEDKAKGERTYWQERLASAEAGELHFIYSGRNYELFAMLADVRNGRGFAGCDTGDRLNPIAEPKGLPEDVSPEAAKGADEWGCDGHSHSYLTVRELLEYDWNQINVLRGFVNENEYRHFKEHGEPDGWCGGVGGPGVAKITNAQMDELLADPATHKEDGKYYYTQIQWSLPYHASAGSFYTWSLPKLKELAGDDPESVRIVFWFDN